MLSTPGAWASLRTRLVDALTRERRKLGRAEEDGRWDGNDGMGKPQRFLALLSGTGVDPACLVPACPVKLPGGWLKGATPRRVIVVPGRLLSLVL